MAGLLPASGDALVHPLVGDLRDAGDLDVGLRLEVEQVARADQADADEPDAHAIVRADHRARFDAAVATDVAATLFRNVRRDGMAVSSTQSPASGCCQGARYGRVSSAFASSSPTTCRSGVIPGQRPAQLLRDVGQDAAAVEM